MVAFEKYFLKIHGFYALKNIASSIIIIFKLTNLNSFYRFRSNLTKPY